MSDPDGPESIAFGPDARLETLLSDYGLGADSWVADAVESDTDRLLMALLLEQRGDRTIQTINQTAGSQSGEADYESYRGLQATSEFDELSWGYPAETVVVHDLSKPLVVTLKEPAREHSEIRVDAKDSPFVLSGVSGVGAEQAWYKRPDGAENHSFSLLALGE